MEDHRWMGSSITSDSSSKGGGNSSVNDPIPYVVICLTITVVFGLTISFIHALIKILRNDCRASDSAREPMDFEGETAHGLPLAMELPSPTDIANGVDLRNADPPRSPSRTDEERANGGSFAHEPHNNTQSEISHFPPSRVLTEHSHPERPRLLFNHAFQTLPFLQSRLEEGPRRGNNPQENPNYPEALPHNPVMVYYDTSENADPHLYRIGHEYQDHILSSNVLNGRGSTNNHANTHTPYRRHHHHPHDDYNHHKMGIEEAMEPSELAYGHARYLSDTTVSSIPCSEIVFNEEEKTECE